MCLFQDSNIEMCVCFRTVRVRCVFHDSEIEMCVCFRTVRLRWVFQDGDIDLGVSGQWNWVTLIWVFQDSEIELCVSGQWDWDVCVFQDSEIEMCVCFRTVRLRCVFVSGLRLRCVFVSGLRLRCVLVSGRWDWDVCFRTVRLRFVFVLGQWDWGVCLFQDSDIEMCVSVQWDWDVCFRTVRLKCVFQVSGIEMCVCFRTVRLRCAFVSGLILRCVFQDSEIEMCVCFRTVRLRCVFVSGQWDWDVCLFQDSEIEMCVCFRTVRLRCWLTSVTCRRSLTSCVCTLVTPTSSRQPVSRSSWTPQGLTASPGHSRYSAVFLLSLSQSSRRGWSRRFSSICVWFLFIADPVIHTCNVLWVILMPLHKCYLFNPRFSIFLPFLPIPNICHLSSHSPPIPVVVFIMKPSSFITCTD